MPRGHVPKRDSSSTTASPIFGRIQAGGIDSGSAADGHVLTADGSGGAAWEAPPGGGGSGDVVGPASADDGFLAVFDGTTGKQIRQANVTADGSGNLSTQGGDLTTQGGNVVTGPGLVDGRDVSVDGAKLDGIQSGAQVNHPDTVLGPASCTDHALARYDGTTGQLIQDSGVTLSDTGDMAGVASLNVNGNISALTGFLNADSAIITGNITVGGTVDGRDVASDGTKLDGIEAGADVTDYDNVEDALAGGTSGSGGFVSVRPGVGLISTVREITAGTGISVADGDGISGDPTITATTKAIRTIPFASSAATSGQRRLNTAGSNNATSSVSGWIQAGAGYDMTLVGVSVMMELTAYTSGQPSLDIEYRDESVPSQTTVTVVLDTPTGTGDYRFYTASVPTLDVDAEDWLGATLYMNYSGAVMTADDMTVFLHFKTRDPVT